MNGKPRSRAMQRALAAVKRLNRGDRKVTVAEVTQAMNVDAAVRRRRDACEEREEGRERDEPLH